MAKYTPEQQKELMETSLRNVRALVDQIEAEEASEKRTQKRVFIVLGAAVAVLIVIVGLVLVRKPETTQLTFPPQGAAPAKPEAPAPR